jgi:hypothetical protein
LCGSTCGRRKRWRCAKIKDRKKRNTREEETGREEGRQKVEEERRKGKK